MAIAMNGRYLEDFAPGQRFGGAARIRIEKERIKSYAARELDVRTKTGLPIRLVDLRIVNEELRDVAHHGKSESPGESWCGRRG